MIPGGAADHQRDPEERGAGDLCGHHLLPHGGELCSRGRDHGGVCRLDEHFIYPGYRFKVLDGLITNFHLPESTLIMLVSALAGREHVLAAYREAVGAIPVFLLRDAMLIRDFK